MTGLFLNNNKSISVTLNQKKSKEKTLLNKVHHNLVAQFKQMGLMEFKYRRCFLFTTLVMATIYLTRVTPNFHSYTGCTHHAGIVDKCFIKYIFPERAVSCQIEDPTFNIFFGAHNDPATNQYSRKIIIYVCSENKCLTY